MAIATARSRLPDSPPIYTAWNCSPLLSFATSAGLDRTVTDLLYRLALRAEPCVMKDKASRYAANTPIICLPFRIRQSIFPVWLVTSFLIFCFAPQRLPVLP